MFTQLTIQTGRRLLLITNKTSQRLGKCKFSYLACGVTNVAVRNNIACNLHKHSKIVGLYFVRHENTFDAIKTAVPSTVEVVQKADIANKSVIQNSIEGTANTKPEIVYISEIPDPPTPPSQDIAETILQFHPNGEATFASIGLGGYSPVGLVQSTFEYLHISWDLPWWGTIMVLALAMRIIIFPVTVKIQRNMAGAKRYQPQIIALQNKMAEARRYGNEYEAAVHGHDLSELMKMGNINPLMSVALGVIQIPIFLTYFRSLWGMTKVPVESLHTGGLFWFSDLTIADPYYILPLISCGTFWVTLSLASRTYEPTALKVGMVALPLIVLPFVINMSAALTFYFATTNIIGICQTRLLQFDTIKTLLKIPIYKEPKKVKESSKSKGFKTSVKESWNNLKITSKLDNKRRADLTQFNLAAKGAIKKTYKYNPLEQQRTEARIAVKKT